MGRSLITDQESQNDICTDSHNDTRSLIAIAIILALAVPALAQVAPGKAVMSQITAIQQIKQNLTPAQKKMDSSLAFAVVGQKSPAAVSSFATAMTPLAKSTTGKVIVEITAKVSPELVQSIQKLGGDVLYQSSRWNSIRAALPLGSVETVAARSDVTRVAKPPLARTNVGALTSQGYVAHRAKQVVEQQGINGGGVNVGVLSDSASPAEVTALKASGDLPPTAYVLAGQDGTNNSGYTDEGTAMMEIVYDMAPGSNQIFATAFNGEASFADNIIALQAAGCKVIADDVTYSDEGVFQDTIVAQAVNQVVANGSSYFSSAGNSGSQLDNNSEAYEGDFRDGGPVTGVIAGTGETGHFHDFGGQLFDRVAAGPSGVVILQWSDPYPGACNDYDLYVTNSAGTVIKGFSAAVQDCSAGSIPDEEVDYGTPAAPPRNQRPDLRCASQWRCTCATHQWMGLDAVHQNDRQHLRTQCWQEHDNHGSELLGQRQEGCCSIYRFCESGGDV